MKGEEVCEKRGIGFSRGVDELVVFLTPLERPSFDAVDLEVVGFNVCGLGLNSLG